MKKSLAPGDAWARPDGEEFGVLFAQADLTEASRRANALPDAARTAGYGFATSDGPAVTVSIGVAAMQAGSLPTVAMRRADLALIHAKAGGRNRVRVSG